MEVKLRAMTCGHLTGDFGHLMEGGEDRIRIPSCSTVNSAISAPESGIAV